MDYFKYSSEDFLNDDSFLNYCHGKNPVDTAYWEKLLAEQPTWREKALEAKKIGLLLSIRVDAEEKKRALQHLKTAIAGSPQLYKPRHNWIRWISAAAAILLVGGLFFWWQAGNPDQNQFASHLVRADFTLLAKTAVSERREMVLADGSRVILNGGSELRIATGYNKKSRLLWLSGEAFFKVEPNRDAPFIVRTANSSTAVLGTSFKVKQEAGRQITSIMLASGKVMVKDLTSDTRSNKLILNPGEMTLLDGKTFRKSSFQKSEMDDWLNQKLLFSSAGFAEISQRLEAIYGVKLQADAIMAQQFAFTGELQGLKLEDVMDAITFANHCTFHIEGNKVMIK
ncbi:FecR family protein [bacterium A37T11]|nr:FecR family protein [bacterium A37T11]